MTNIQIHNVTTVMWLKTPGERPDRTLRCILADGTIQDVTIFKARPETEAEDTCDQPNSTSKPMVS